MLWKSLHHSILKNIILDKARSVSQQLGSSIDSTVESLESEVFPPKMRSNLIEFMDKPIPAERHTGGDTLLLQVDEYLTSFNSC